MFLGAILDLGLDKEVFLGELKKLPLSDYEVEIKKSIKSGITGTDVYVKTHEHHPHRGLKEIYEIIDKSTLKPSIKQKSKEAFLKLAKAEGKVHGKSPDKIHFHEVGAVDSIVDIVGACVLVDMLGVKHICASSVNVGSGTVKCAHGQLPVPAPATVEILKGIPVYSQGEEGELTTPTGALLLSSFVTKFGSMPAGIPRQIGYGLGKAERETPNVLRAVLLDAEDSSLHTDLDGYDRDNVVILEANIDDMNPQLYDDVMEGLFEGGALDVFLTQIIMKKNRPAVKLTCISPPEKQRYLKQRILEGTTTIGVRAYTANRIKLHREIKSVNTSMGEIRVKICKKGEEIVRVIPEYDDIKELSRKMNMPILKAYKSISKDI